VIDLDEAEVALTALVDEVPCREGYSYDQWERDRDAVRAALRELRETRAALTALRDWSVKTREEYRSGYVQMTVTPQGAMPYALHAERTFNGPIAVLLHVTAECNRVLKGAGAAVAGGEG
jgi:hypothetical protein